MEVAPEVRARAGDEGAVVPDVQAEARAYVDVVVEDDLGVRMAQQDPALTQPRHDERSLDIADPTREPAQLRDHRKVKSVRRERSPWACMRAHMRSRARRGRGANGIRTRAPSTLSPATVHAATTPRRSAISW